MSPTSTARHRRAGHKLAVSAAALAVCLLPTACDFGGVPGSSGGGYGAPAGGSGSDGEEVVVPVGNQHQYPGGGQNGGQAGGGQAGGGQEGGAGNGGAGGDQAGGGAGGGAEDGADDGAGAGEDAGAGNGNGAGAGADAGNGDGAGAGAGAGDGADNGAGAGDGADNGAGAGAGDGADNGNGAGAGNGDGGEAGTPGLPVNPFAEQYAEKLPPTINGQQTEGVSCEQINEARAAAGQAPLEFHEGFQVEDARCVPTAMGSVAAQNELPSLLITAAPEQVGVGQAFQLKVSTRNLVRDRFLGAAAGGYYLEASVLNGAGLQRGHFHTACRILPNTNEAPDSSGAPAFFLATQDNGGNNTPDTVTIDVPGIATAGTLQCTSWAGDGSHRTPMMSRANQTPAIDSVRIEVGGNAGAGDAAEEDAADDNADAGNAGGAAADDNAADDNAGDNAGAAAGGGAAGGAAADAADDAPAGDAAAGDAAGGAAADAGNAAAGGDNG